VVRGLVIDARQRRLLRLDNLAACVAELGNAAGTAGVRRVLGELDEARPDSVFEHVVRGAAAPGGAAAVPGAVALRAGPARGYRLVRGEVGLECDGFGSHAERAALDTDALRHNGLGDVGWQVRRVTWTTYHQHWPELIAQLRRLLITAGSAVG